MMKKRHLSTQPLEKPWTLGPWEEMRGRKGRSRHKGNCEGLTWLQSAGAGSRVGVGGCCQDAPRMGPGMGVTGLSTWTLSYPVQI